MSKKQGEDVSAVAEMERLVRHAAPPPVAGEKVPHAIARAARRLGLTRGRVESFWYGKARHVDPEELENARRAAVAQSRDVELLRHEHQCAMDILQRLEGALAHVDPDFHSPQLDALGDIRGSLSRGRSDR